jgi:hypothetical protein
VADEIAAAFAVESVRVRVRKRPPDIPLEWSAATAVRTRS